MGYNTQTGPTGPLPTESIDELLKPPTQPVRTVIDTDTDNEIDDHFAVIYALLSDALSVEAIYSAPFDNPRSDGPQDGMEKSYNRILELIDLVGHTITEQSVFHGSSRWMSSTSDPIESPATEDLLTRASDTEDVLYVISLGAPTNVASAIEQDPGIIDDIVIVWLGGHPHTWHNASEFNLFQDMSASQLLFDSGVPLVQVPCKNVAEQVRTTGPELEKHLRNKGKIAEYLLDLFRGYDPSQYEYEETADDVYSHEIWDLTPIAYLVNSEWVPTHLVHSPELSHDQTYNIDTSRHLIRVAQDAKRDFIFDDLFTKVTM